MNIFISYGHDDHAKLAKRIVKDFDDLGYKVWIDVNQIEPGDDYEVDIENGIKNSDWILVMMTQHSMRRPNGYCLDEVSYAKNLNKDIIPIKIQEVALPISISRTQWLDMSRYFDEDGNIIEEYYKEKFEGLNKIIRRQLKLEDLLDTHFDLLKYLNPLDNESYLTSYKKDFYGREWLFDLYEKWINEADKSRVFALVGQAGSGKTAFVSKLCETKKEVVAIHFCKYNNDERANPKRAIMSLAFHLSTQIPEYKQILGGLSDLHKLNEKNVNRLFEYLFIEPLNKLTQINKTHVLIIDALDEAAIDSKNELMDLIINEFPKTPKWLRLLVSSRPEQDIFRKLKALNPTIIESNQIENTEDITGYLTLHLEDVLKTVPNPEELVLKIVMKSEGNFLYTTEIVKSINKGDLLLKDIDSFPIGLVNIYSNYFIRLFENNTDIDYRKDIRPLLEVITASYEPLDIDIIVDILDIDEYYSEDLFEYIYVLFPTVGNKLEPIHKSLVDWLVDRESSGKYYISKTHAHNRLAEYFYEKYENDELSDYVIKYLTKHLLESKKWELSKDVLINLNLQKARISQEGQDTAIRFYIIEIEKLNKLSKHLCQEVLKSNAFKYIFRENRRYLYNTGLYFSLQNLDFDMAINDYISSNSIGLVAGCVDYLYIIEKYQESSKLALQMTSTFDVEEHKDIFSEVYNEIALSHRKLVNFDECIDYANKVVSLTCKKTDDFYEQALANQTLGKVYYHRMIWDKGLYHLEKAVSLLKETAKITNNDDYTNMLKLYIAAFEREVALSLVWNYKHDLAKVHLNAAYDIYNKISSRDRYYVRCLYVDMFNAFLQGDIKYALKLYPSIINYAKSYYDKSQLEFYCALGLYINHMNEEEISIHIDKAEEYITKLDAYIEKNEILLLKYNHINKDETKRIDIKRMSDNKDIINWINYVDSLIAKKRKDFSSV